ncbi:xanthine dehydrogenase molybdenum binding subunit apoprotein [Litoreibacter meonggei]|uniref:Xanthine dehydrogenase molybdenum binding subunit apoprotein n=1 Tax=Litoreibacter meonggei TaxID=1049199 RepID=A0A497WRU1_9RHOB|nr:xanthine dehydrogenase molybdopterin binding subunit [Litoreibacter meonggei]RLJ59360.1 xanthine dehydrogenase molybdenum binding subunit apoprotein [Litoreibacter meonggei]
MSVGKNTAHDAGPLHVTGAARYTDDIPTPRGTLYLASGLSSIAKGAITAVNLDAVRVADGVVDVLVAGDLLHDNDVSPSNHDEPLLATGDVHYLGQPIFLVVATSHLAARKAARLAKVAYNEQTPILTIDEAMAANSRFEDGPRIYTKGDAEAQLGKATNRVQGSFEIGGQEHFYLEGHAALAVPQEGSDMVVHASSQHPTEIQHKVAEALGRPMNAVRVEVRRMGGGFGGKESQGNALCVACAVVAQKHHVPVKMRYDRDDDMIVTGKRHEFRIDYDVGFDARGRIQAVDFVHYARCGWAQDLSLPVADRAMLHADNAYNLDHARITSHRLKTNTQSNTAFRGFGGPQGVVGIERVMDHIAHHLGLDALQVRRENFYASGGNISAKMKSQTTPYGMEVTDSIVREMVDALEVSSDYQARRRSVSEWNDKNPVLKRGISLTPVKFGISFTLTHLNQAGALVHVYQDGSIHLNHGGTEMGQGLFTKVAQVAAQCFGVPLDVVKITATDTGKVPNTSATAASSGSDLNGMAVLNACEKIKARVAKFLSNSEVVFEGGLVRFDKQELSFAEAVSKAYQNRISLSATGFYATPDVQWDRIKGHGRPFFYFAYGAAVTEVVIDTLTGENRILRADILHDCGRSLNPALDIGQIEGGYVQGAGWLTTEELIWDARGNLKTHAPSTYKIPATSDRPEVFNVALWDGENRAETVFKSKAVGEPPLMHGISAWSALSNAIAACGDAYPDLDAPATAERVLMACQRLRG